MQDTSAHKLTVTPMNDTTKQPVTIKKYANRRLYNTATSTYVTLETLAGMVKDDIEFFVYDAKTSEDITGSVLRQIIMEEEGKPGQQGLLPNSFLRQLISCYGDNMQWLVPKYLEHSMQAFSTNQEQITNYFQTAFGNMFPFGSTLEEMSKQNLALFENALRMFSPFVTMAPDVGTATSKPMSTAPTPPRPQPTRAETHVSACQMPTSKDEPMATVTKLEPRHEAPPAAQTHMPEPAPEPVKPVAVVTPVAPPMVRPEPVMPAPVETAKATTPPTPTTTQTTTVAVSTPAPSTVSTTTVASAAYTPSAPVTMSAPSMAMPKAAPTTTPMPNVQSAVVTATPTAEDMQQKIANLQRQLAELAKNRA